MLDLAMNDNGENISIKAISDRQGISTKYLEQIISTLNRAGYVKVNVAQAAATGLRKAPRNIRLV